MTHDEEIQELRDILVVAEAFAHSVERMIDILEYEKEYPHNPYGPGDCGGGCSHEVGSYLNTDRKLLVKAIGAIDPEVF